MLSPMLATLADPPLTDPKLLYEPKYDGIRAIAEVPAGGKGVRLWSRLGNEKTSQFPEVAAALASWARRRKQPAVLDGEIVALDANGDPAGFQQLQGRIHLIDQPPAVTQRTRRTQRNSPDVRGGRLQPAQSTQRGTSTAYILFDLLREGDKDLRGLPLAERRAALERLVGRDTNETLRLSEVAVGDGRALYQRALESGWEGLIAKVASSKYHSGKRTPEWRKLKILQEQEFVVGGWTEPRNMRSYFGALLLGVYDGAGNLNYTGHTGTGFNEKELSRVMRLLEPLETKENPFSEPLKTNERPHWVQPKLVAQVKFTEWTADGRLRHPVYLGLRDDKKPDEVVREKAGRVRQVGRVGQVGLATWRPALAGPSATRQAGQRGRVNPYRSVLDQLEAIRAASGNGVLDLPGGTKLEVTNLRKVFWPEQKITKGDLFKYYVQVAPFILPAVADRPLVMKRHPNGITGKPFYQHSVEKQTIPPGVRVEPVASEKRLQLVGGSLTTLLYMVQLAAISQDPWFSRVRAPQFADYVALDLDPSEGVSFGQVLDVARWIHEELEELGGIGVPKTSGSRGLHIYLPLPPRTPYEAGLLFCQILAMVVSTKHPRQATIERSVRGRGRRVYVDYLQNIQGKTLATAYSARASDYAGVSTPLTWTEVHEGVARDAFTMTSVPPRLAEVGDLWATPRTSKGNSLERVLEYANKKQGDGKRR
jgi:bifunctional non-homologous end joining protein LigD